MKVTGIALLAGACVSIPPAAERDAAVDQNPDAAVSDADLPDSAPPGCDQDGDGYLASSCQSSLPADCDDGEEAIHPGAFDTCDNSVDEDCLGGALPCDQALAPITSSTATVRTVESGWLTVTFDPGEGGMIDTLAAASSPVTNLLYTGTMNERLIGVEIWNHFFSWETATQPTVTQLTSGRGMYRVRVQWVAHNGTSTGLSGDSYYTIHPDGRIHRDENVEVAETVASGYLTSYVALEPSLFTHADWGSNTPDSAYDLSTFEDHAPFYIVFSGDPSERVGWSCAWSDSSGDLVGLAWQIPDAVTSGGPRITESEMGGFPGNHQIALQFDWTRSGEVTAGSYRGDFMVALRRTDSDACAPVRALYEGWAFAPALIVEAPASLKADEVGDHDADGYVEGGGYWSMEASAGGVSFTVDTMSGTRASPATSSFSIHGLHGDTDAVVLVDGSQLEHGRDYLLHLSGTVGWLHLNVPLTDGRSVEVRQP